MRTNLLNGLSNVVKKGAGLACSWSQVGRMSGEGAIEHPLSTHSAPFGTRWKPAGEKGSTRVWKHVAMIFAVLVMSVANVGVAWGAEYTFINQGSGKYTGDFYTGRAESNVGSSSMTIKGLSCSYRVKLNSTGSPGVPNTDRYIKYDVKTTTTQIIVYFYNDNSSSARSINLGEIKEGEGSFETTRSKSIAKKTADTLIYNASNTTNSTIYITVPSSAGDVYFYQVRAIESGTDLLKVGEAGYTLDFNKGRVATKSGETTIVDAITISKPSSDYTAASGTSLALPKNAPTTSYLSFTTPATPSNLKLTWSGSGQMAYNTSASASGATNITSGTGYSLSASTTYYLVNTSSGSGTTITKLEFITPPAPKDYTVTAATSTGTDTYGTVSAGASSLDATETTTITATPATGYQVTNWAVSGTGANISPSGASNSNTTTLTMGSANATVTVTFGPVYASGTYTFTGHQSCGTSPNNKEISSSAYTNYGAFRVDELFFSATKMRYETGGEAQYDGWKIQYKDATIKFLVENDCNVKITLGANAGMNITYTRQNSTETTTALSANMTNSYDVEGGTLVTLTTTSSSTITLKEIQVGSSCTAPNHVDVTPTAEAGNYGWRYTIGETLKLTATPYSSEGTSSPITSGITGYQWQKYVGSEWVNLSNGGDISGATSANLVISNLTSSNGGSYRCVISTGATCSTASTGYWVRVFTLNGNYYGSAWTENPIVWSSEYVGVATVSLNASSTYMFKVYDNDGKYFGSGSGNYIIEDGDDKDCGTGNADIRLFTGPAGNYTFTVNVENAAGGSAYVNVVTGYPTVSHPAMGYMYVSKWWDCYPHWWDGSSNALTSDGNDPKITKYTTICGTDYWYMPVLDNYTNVYFKDNATWGSAGNHGEETSSTGNSGKYYTHDGSSWGWHDFTTYTITYAANGGEGSMSSIVGICPNSSQAITANAFEKTGYTFNCWHADKAVKVSGSTISAGGDIAGGATIQEINNDITLTAQWSPIPVTSITVSPLSKTLDVDGTQQLSVEVLPATALDKAVTWSTSDGSVATVSSTGLVTAEAPGSATITATAHDGSGVTGTCSITVNKIQPTKYDFSVNKTVLCGEETATLTLEDSEDGVTYELREDSSTPIAETQKTGTGSALTWTGLGAGNYVVYAVADATYTERQMNGSKITISAGTTTSITTQPTNQEVTVGEKATLSVVAAGTSLSYQWKESATEDGTYSNVASGGASASYSVTPAAAGAKWYKCVVTGTCGTETTEARKIVANAAADPLVSWTMNLNNATWGAASTSNHGNTEITSITTSCNAGGEKASTSATAKVSMAEAEVTTSAAPTNSANFTFTLASGNKIVPEKITCQVFNVSGGQRTYKAQISDNNGHVYNSTNTLAVSSEATLTPATFNFASDLELKGNITLKIYAWDTDDSKNPTEFRMGPDIKFYGEIETACTSVAAPTALSSTAHTSSSLTFTWTKASNASGYTATLYSDAGCESEVTHQDLDDVATVTFSTLSAETTYYCKVQSHGDGSTYCTAGGTTSAQSGTTDAACTAHGLAYGTAAVAKNVGDAAFTNTLTNPNSLTVTYSSSETGVATVNATSGMVTIVGAGSTVITATWAGDATYCSGTATYTLTVSSGCTPQSLVKTQLTSVNAGTTTGYNGGQYAGDPVIATFEDTKVDGGYKLKSNSKLFVTLKGGFVEGDKINIVVTQASDLTNVGKLLIFYDASTPKLLTTIDAASAGKYTYTLTAANITTLGSTTTIGVYRPSSGDNVSNPLVKSVEVEGCREWDVCTAPDAIAVGSVTATGATFTITDAENTNNYEIYYSTSSTAPTAETSATVSGINSKSRAVTGLTAETTYYYWVRSNCGGATKSSWVAGTPASFTTEAAAATHNVTYNGNGSTGGSVPTDDTDYEEGDVVTVLGNTGSLVNTGQTFLGWSTNATASSGTFYPAGYKFYMPNEAVTLYAVWGSASEEKYYYGSISITTGALTPGSTGTKGFFTNNGGEIATSSAISLSSTPGETGYYYESSTLTHTALNKSSNWNTSSTAKRTIRAFKFKSGDSYTLALGSKTATSIMFYGRCGSASRTMTIGGVEYESPSTKEQFFSHEFTKVGNFTSNVTITQDGDFYGILVVTVSTGAASGFTVSFNMNGKGNAIADIENVPSGSKIGAPVPAPTAVGVEFGGWYREAGCTNAWNFGSSTISKDTTLYAKWTTCAPSISAHPVAATYTKDAAATALSVTASGEGLNYQWYTSEDGSADIQGSSAIPGATSASYTPSTSLLGTIYYFCVVSNTCGNAVSNKAAITVNDSKPAPTANWDIEEPEEGGKGFTFSIEVNKNNGENWDGELLASMLTLSDNAILDGASIVVNNTDKTISGTYGVKAGSSSPVTFYLLLPATATQSATRLDRNRTFTPCAGGAGDSYNVRVRKDYEKDASNNYRWVTPGAGEITYAVGSSISSAAAASAVGVFDSIMSNDKQYVWVKTYVANTKTIRLHVLTSGANVSVSALYKNTVYTAAADKDIVSSDDYTVSYDGSGTAENTGVKGTHYMDITFDSPLDANDIICIKFSSSKVKAYGAVLTTVGDGGDQTTGLTWSNGQVSGATLVKREDAADFAITAVRDATALKSLGLISYTSSNTAIATIDGATGLVHIADNIDFGSDEFKTTTITATLAASGCYEKAVITYILKVTKYVCEDTPGTITYVDRGCSGMDLTLEAYEEGATIQWYKNGTEIPSATSATYSATEPGEYYAVSHKNCDITSTNSVTLETATATAEKIVDSWYVKNGRRTPDIALVQTTGATSFTVTSGGTITEIGGCTFELKDDGIIYLHGQKEDGSAPSDMTAGDMTITITVSGCSGALSGLNITIHKQAETAKPTVAFVVDGTLRKDGGTATSVSEAKTSDRPLWTYLSSSYALTGCNVYWSVDSKELREYYSQYDAILITDDPSTYTTGTGGVPYVKAFGTMVDVRPILTMEAFVGRYSDGGWHVYKADPTSPNPRQVEMKLECKNHDIFKGLDPNASDNVRTTTDEHGNEYWHVIMVDTTVAPYHNTSKDYKTLPALQGFDPHKFDRMLGVGTIAEETLQGGVERQEEPAARMMILGIQNEAMAALTNEGKLIIKNAIEYLLKTNMEDVNDCSNYFTGGPSGTGDNWATAENWSSGKVPDFESRVRILRPVVISGDTKAIVARVDIATSGKSKWVDGECNGSVTVNPRGALIVGGKIRRAHAPLFGVDNLEPTENDDLIVKASTTDPHNQGALIFDNSDGDTRAVVEMWNPSYWVVDGGTGKKTKYWSYVAVPIQEADIPNFFWYGFTYLYDETSGWIKKSDGTSLYPFQGIGASLQEGNMETFYGPLATTESQDITLTYTAGKGQGMNLIGNSWTAPIQIANFEEDDFGDAAAEVWVFNTGNKNVGHSTMTDGSSGTTTAGQWQTIPIGVAGLPGYTGLKVIPAMQAFEVNTETKTTLHLDYDRLVRAGRENLNEPMRAPRRSAAKQIEATMRVRVSGELTHTDVYLLKDARFSDAFDNGWDGHYLFGDDRSASLYAVSETEGAMAFLAQPEIDGTILGFAPSRYGNDYTFTFYYLGEEEYYLNDIKLQKSTLISEEESYLFTFEEGDTNRFYISKTPFNAPSVATGTENTGDGVKARKVLVNDKLYIILNGKVYSAEGVMVK